MRTPPPPLPLRHPIRFTYFNNEIAHPCGLTISTASHSGSFTTNSVVTLCKQDKTQSTSAIYPFYKNQNSKFTFSLGTADEEQPYGHATTKPLLKAMRLLIFNREVKSKSILPVPFRGHGVHGSSHPRWPPFSIPQQHCDSVRNLIRGWEHRLLSTLA